MKTKPCFALLVVILVTVCALASCRDTALPLEIDVMSFNIRYGTAGDGEDSWTNRREMVFDIIRQQAPDLIGLQEALRFQLDEIVEQFPEYGEVGLGRDGGTEGEYSAILYRRERFDVDDSGTFWLSDTPETPSVHWGNACIRICTWGRFVDKQSAAAVYLFNTHLDHVFQPSSEKSVRLIADTIRNRATGDPFVLTGDFNADETNPAILYLKSRGSEGADTSNGALPMVDTYRILYPDEVEVGTFNGFQGQSDRGKIDYIFVAAGTTTLAASIDRTQSEGRCPSDHYPVTARVRF